MNDLSYIRGIDLKLSDLCSVKHPTLGEIEELNRFEEKYEVYLSSLILSYKDMADILWFENKIWYEDIKSEWKFFLERIITSTEIAPIKMKVQNEVIESDGLVLKGLIKEALNFFLQKDCNFALVQENAQNENDESQIFLAEIQKDGYIYEDGFRFTEHYYLLMVEFLKKINWNIPTYEFTKGGTQYAKIVMLKQQYKKRKKKQKKENQNLASLVSSLITNGISVSEIWKMPIYEVYEQYYRIKKRDEENNTNRALYGGCIDTKKNPIKWDKIDWTTIISFE